MIVCRSAAELERLRDAGRLVGEVLAELAAAVAPGVSTADLDALAEKRIAKAGATPAFKGYHGYPATICASINDEVIHGIPSGRRVLQEGDIISIDVGASLDGYFGDSAITLPVGQVSERAAALLRVTEEALYKAIPTVLSRAVEAILANPNYDESKQDRSFMKVHMKGGKTCPRCGHRISQLGSNREPLNFCRGCQL